MARARFAIPAPSHAPLFGRRRLTRALACAVVALIALATSGVAAAQINTALTVAIVPPVAAAGVARQVSVTLQWPMGCLPDGATVVGNDTARKRTVTIRLNGNLDSSLQNVMRCGDAIVSYRATVNVTPEAEGDLRVLIVNDSGVYLGETTIHTRAANSNRSQYDLTGMWYDPASYGSGLTFIHGFARNDVMFGTWYVYDSLGAPRWYTIQYVQWKAGGLQADGQIYATTANFMCLPPLSVCPMMYATVMPLAQAHIVMQGPNRATIQALTSSGAVLFSSDIVRSIF